MGLSASQVKLLSLTSRINQVELRAQKIANAKLSLSDSTEAASEAYVNALNDTNFAYTTYDSYGNTETQQLTGAALYSYSALKNQYALVNTAGQVMVSEVDAQNFEESDTLEEFLDKYGLLTSLEDGSTIQVRNSAYDEASADYIERYTAWQEATPNYEDYADTESYAQAYQIWIDSEPAMEDVEEYLEVQVRDLTDEDKGQWYINLWHRMNGDCDYKSGYLDDDYYNQDLETWSDYLKTGQSYAVLEDGLMNSAEWLEFALKNGVVTIEQAQYTAISDADSAMTNITWTSIVYSSMTELSEESNNTAITKAEVEYQRIQEELEAKDQEFDNQLKQLDTEHNTLQTEYDSIQNVIDNNIERTLKLYT